MLALLLILIVEGPGLTGIFTTQLRLISKYSLCYMDLIHKLCRSSNLEVGNSNQRKINET